MEEEANSNANFRRSHLVAMPFPGRGHINPMLNLCSLLLSSQPDLLISFVVTEEWLGFLCSEQHHPAPPNLRFVAIPQVIPSELGRANDFVGFFEAVMTKLQGPFERVLDRLEPPATAIIYDMGLTWVVGVGNQRNIPLAALYTQSASMFAILSHHLDLLVQRGHLPSDLLASGKSKEKVDHIPRLPSTIFADLPTFFHGIVEETLHRAFESIVAVNRAQCLLFTSVHEFEEQVINEVKEKLSIPIYPIGPMIPYFKLQSSSGRGGHRVDFCDSPSYFQWLDSQPKESVLYISQGSFLSISSAQMDEIIAGIKESGVRFLWVTRGDWSRFKDEIGELGCLVPWCDQLKVLCHPSIGGFWTHCGWNSTSESIYAGVPMLTCPIYWDQIPNSKQIVSDWKVGCRVFKNDHKETFVTRHEIARLVSKFMDSKSDERKETINRVKSLQETCRKAIANGGSANSNLVDFIRKFC